METPLNHRNKPVYRGMKGDAAVEDARYDDYLPDDVLDVLEEWRAESQVKGKKRGMPNIGKNKEKIVNSIKFNSKEEWEQWKEVMKLTHERISNYKATIQEETRASEEHWEKVQQDWDELKRKFVKGKQLAIEA